MLGASRDSLADARSALVGRADEPGFDRLSAELLSVATLLGRERSLRGVLSDSGTTGGQRETIVASLFGARISPLALAVVDDVVGRRWSEPRDLVDSLELLGAEAAFIVAERAGRLDTVENELFAFGRIYTAEPTLQLTLTDPGLPSEQKSALLRDLLATRVEPETLAVLEHAVVDPRGRRLESAIDALVQLAATRRESLLALVTVAHPLVDDQEPRLAAALAAVYRRPVTLAVEVDPDVLGGVTVQIGDEVIDGSIAHRLEQARRAVG